MNREVIYGKRVIRSKEDIESIQNIWNIEMPYIHDVFSGYKKSYDVEEIHRWLEDNEFDGLHCWYCHCTFDNLVHCNQNLNIGFCKPAYWDENQQCMTEYPIKEAKRREKESK